MSSNSFRWCCGQIPRSAWLEKKILYSFRSASRVWRCSGLNGTITCSIHLERKSPSRIWHEYRIFRSYEVRAYSCQWVYRIFSEALVADSIGDKTTPPLGCDLLAAYQHGCDTLCCESRKGKTISTVKRDMDPMYQLLSVNYHTCTGPTIYCLKIVALNSRPHPFLVYY